MSDTASVIAEEIRTASAVGAAAATLRQCRATVYRNIALGKIRALRVGKKLLIPARELERLLLATRSG